MKFRKRKNGRRDPVVPPSLPVRLSAWVVAMAIGFSGVVGILSGVMLARRAANLDPVEALRYE